MTVNFLCGKILYDLKKNSCLPGTRRVWGNRYTQTPLQPLINVDGIGAELLHCFNDSLYVA